MNSVYQIGTSGTMKTTSLVFGHNTFTYFQLFWVFVKEPK